MSKANHAIVDDQSGLHIHLQLNGTFSYFPSRALTIEEQERWDEFPVIFLTPDSDAWDPHATHFAEAEAAMLDCDGEIVNPASDKGDGREPGGKPSLNAGNDSCQ